MDARKELAEEARLGKGEYGLEKEIDKVTFKFDDKILDLIDKKAPKIPELEEPIKFEIANKKLKAGKSKKRARKLLRQEQSGWD